MSDKITIKRRTKVFEASDGACSINGVDWFDTDGRYIVESSPYRKQFFMFEKAHIGPRIVDARPFDSTPDDPEAVRAKVGDWVKSQKTGHTYKVDEVIPTGVISLLKNGSGKFAAHGNYTIVPAPTPATFTGDPSEWGPGVYGHKHEHMWVIVNDFNDWCWFSDELKTFRTRKNWKGSMIGSTYTRISTNPADAIDFAKLAAMPAVDGEVGDGLSRTSD